MQRLVRTPGGVELAGRAVEDADGVAAGPGGEELRQVVQDRIAWECSTWCSADGVVYDRVYDPFLDAFVWSAPKRVGVDPSTGHFTTTVGHDTDLKRGMRLVRAVALAWVEPPRTGGVRLQAAPLPGLPPVASNLVWVRTGVRAFVYEGAREEPVAFPPSNDSWRPLRYAWRGLCGEVVARVDESQRPPGERYEVSLRGWVRSPHGSCTRGVRSPSGRRYASLVELGAVWIDEAVVCSFDDDDHSKNEDNAVEVDHLNADRSDDAYANLRRRRLHVSQPRHDETLDLVRGKSMPDVCASLGVARSTAWDRISSAARELPLSQALSSLSPLAPTFVRHAIRQSMEDGHIDAADTLSRVLDQCDSSLSSHPTWPLLDLEDRYGIVKLARTLTLRKGTAERASSAR